MDLGERISPSSVSDLRKALFNVEPLSDAITLYGRKSVSARWGWAGEKSDFFSILLGTGRRRQIYFDARVVSIDVFVEMGFDDTVVVDAESFTEGILRNLEPAIDVSPQGRRKIEPDGQGEPFRLELSKEGGTVSGLRQLQPHELSHLGLIGTTSRRDQSSPIHCGILMVHTGRHREGQGYRMILGRWV
jgi:hypothetical protein